MVGFDRHWMFEPAAAAFAAPKRVCAASHELTLMAKCWRRIRGSLMGVVRPRHRPDCVEMLGKQDDGGNLERPTHPATAKKAAEQAAGKCVTEEGDPQVSDQGEEERAAGEVSTSAVRHGRTM